ncbi:hypothetical protein C8039_03725 [Halogeometricum sp. wsp3]|nr:hypothetical protein C8039_03725 [Halogeometricum sp. wsp3]
MKSARAAAATLIRRSNQTNPRLRRRPLVYDQLCNEVTAKHNARLMMTELLYLAPTSGTPTDGRPPDHGQALGRRRRRPSGDCDANPPLEPK